MDTVPPERAALLIVRAWLEGPEQRLVARITTTLDVIDQPAKVSAVGSVEDLYEAVQGWLDGMRSLRNG
jgi:hypothetical protein